MKLLCVTSVLACLILADISLAAGLYKCESADGSVSFQDQPCATHEKEEVRRKAPRLIPTGIDGSSLARVEVPGVGEALVPVFDTMTVRTRAHGKSAVTVLLKAKSGEEPLELHITLFANSDEHPYNVISAREFLRKVDPSLVRHPYGYGEAWSFEMAYTEARMWSSQQGGRSHRIGPATGYTTTTVGFAKHPLVVAWILILNNGGTSESLRSALKVVNAMQIIDGRSGDVL